MLTGKEREPFLKCTEERSLTICHQNTAKAQYALEIYIYIYIHIYIYIYIYGYVDTYMDIYIDIDMYVWICIHICMDIFVCMYVCMCICMYVTCTTVSLGSERFCARKIFLRVYCKMDRLYSISLDKQWALPRRRFGLIRKLGQNIDEGVLIVCLAKYCTIRSILQ